MGVGTGKFSELRLSDRKSGRGDLSTDRAPLSTKRSPNARGVLSNDSKLSKHKRENHSVGSLKEVMKHAITSGKICGE